MTTLQQQTEQIQKQLRPLTEELASFHELPLDYFSAALKVEEAKQEAERIQAKLVSKVSDKFL